MIFVVLGMHKSGTTMVAEMLHKSGIEMIGQNDGDPGYDSGVKYERVAAAQLNKEILDCSHLYSLDILPVAKSLQLTSDQSVQLNTIIKEKSNDGSWGFKDPRTCLTYECWADYLPDHKVIVVYRHPAQVLLHYWRRNLRRKRPLILFKTIRAWTVYNRRIIDIIGSNKTRYVVIRYEDLMNDEREFERLESFVGQPVLDARRQGSYKMRNKKSRLLDWANRLCVISGYCESYKKVLHVLNRLRQS